MKSSFSVDRGDTRGGRNECFDAEPSADRIIKKSVYETNYSCQIDIIKQFINNSKVHDYPRKSNKTLNTRPRQDEMYRKTTTEEDDQMIYLIRFCVFSVSGQGLGKPLIKSFALLERLRVFTRAPIPESETAI